MPSERTRTILRWCLSAFYAVAGVAHLTVPGGFIAITPDWVPRPADVIFVTGVLELAAAAALFIPSLRKAAGIGLALYALCVWPANFKHAFEAIDVAAFPSSWWYHAPRLVLQPLIIWWALFASGASNWPWAARARAKQNIKP
jgi:uncharacterized membrane protein